MPAGFCWRWSVVNTDTKKFKTYTHVEQNPYTRSHFKSQQSNTFIVNEDSNKIVKLDQQGPKYIHGSTNLGRGDAGLGKKMLKCVIECCTRVLILV